MPLIGGATRSVTPWLPELRQAGEARSVADGAGGSRALVLVTPVAEVEFSHSGSERPMSAFLAQLVATRQRAPQTRAGRRAEPAEAAETYEATLIIPPVKGRVLRRSV